MFGHAGEVHKLLVLFGDLWAQSSRSPVTTTALHMVTVHIQQRNEETQDWSTGNIATGTAQ